MITKQKIITDYIFFKNQAHRALSNKNFDKAIECVEIACKIAYSINFIFSDYALESIAKVISSALFPKNFTYGEHGKVILYDCFALPNRGLTQQYLRALSALFDDVLFVVKLDELDLDSRIHNEILHYSNVNICFVSPKINSKIKQN